MKISEILKEDLILTSLSGKNVSSVLREFAETICAAGKFDNPDLLYERLLLRENQASTDMGNGAAIPHCRIENLKEVIVAIGYSSQGIDFHAMDGNRTHLFFVVVGPDAEPKLLLRMIANVARLLKSNHFISQMQKLPEKSAVIHLIREEESTLVK